MAVYTWFPRQRQTFDLNQISVNRPIILLFGLVFIVSSLCAQVNYRYFVHNGRISLSEDRFPDAIRHFNTAISAKPDLFEAYFLRGVAKFNLSDYQGAIDDFTTTLTIHPLYVRAYHYRGISHDRLKNYYNAKTDFARALAIDPFNADLHVANGATRMHLNDFSGAIEDYNMALMINPGLSYAYLNRGIAKILLDRKAEALQDLDKAVFNDYFDSDAWIRRGMLRSEMDDITGAMEDFNQALKIDDSTPLLFFQRALLHLKQNDTLAALKDYEQVNVLDQRNALTYYNRALLYSLIGQLDASIVLYDEVIKINPQNVYAWYNRGITHYQLRRLKEAEKDFTEAIRIFPDFAGAWINRSVVRREMRSNRESDADYEKAMAIIMAMNGPDANPDSLYHQYADSTYFDKIIELESDFISGEAKSGRVQFRDIDIRPFGFFVVGIKPDTKTTTDIRSMYYNSGSIFESINNTTGRQFALINQTRLNNDAKPELPLNTMDTLIADKAEGGCAGLADFALMQQKVGNYQKALRALDEMKACGDDFDVFGLNAGSIRALLAELSLSDEPYVIDVMIAPRKQSLSKPGTFELPDYNAALNDFQRLVRKQPDNAYALYNTATLKLMMKQYHRSIDDYSEAIRLAPDLAEAYYNRALTLLFLEEEKLACADLSKAGELGIIEAYAVIRKYCARPGQR